MSKSKSKNKSSPRQQKRRRPPAAVRVPGWYYGVLGAIFLIGALLIVYSMRNPTISVEGMTSEGDFPMGSAEAPVTIYEWGSFT